MDLLWQQIPSPMVSEILSSYEDFDGVVLDTEHSMFNNETLFSCIQIISLKNKIPFVRVTEPNKTFVRQCLDSGAEGIIFSTIESIDQCRRIREMCIPPLRGKRGTGLVRKNNWGKQNLFPSRDPIIVAQIETVDGISIVSRILKDAYYVQYLFIGPYDLSASLGQPGCFDNNVFKKTISNFNKLVPDCKKGIHLVKEIEKNYLDYKNYGMLAFGMDTLFIQNSIKKLGDVVS